MISTSEQRRAYSGVSIFSFGFRPFFLGGALIAVFVPLATALSLGGLAFPDTAYGPIAYHGHEMLFGYLGAIVSGFILTAVPNWTGRLPVVGPRLMALFALWIAGRLAILLSGAIGAGAAAAVDLPFLLIMSAVLWREIVTGRNWRNVPICMLMTTLAAGNLLWHLDILGNGDGVAWVRLGIAVIAVLLALIGGRITPSFTRNWLVKAGGGTLDASFRMLDRLALAILVAAMATWSLAPLGMVPGALLLAASGLHFFRLWRWHGWRTLAEPLVAILHVGYFWLPVALALLGISSLAPDVLMPSTALHALTAGAAGVMTLAVMTRATLGHTGRNLQADAVTILIYILVNMGAVIRLMAAVLPQHYAAVVLIAAIFWSGAFLLFMGAYGRYLLSPRLHARPRSD